MKITIRLNEESIDSALNDLENYKQKISERTTELVDFAIKFGEEYAYNNIMNMTGELANGVIGERVGKKGTITAGGNALWVEFGTGVGLNQGYAPHPKRDELGMVAWGEYGLKLGRNPNGWNYKDDSGKWHHTKGIRANMFMWKTSQEIRKRYAKWAKQIFKFK